MAFVQAWTNSTPASTQNVTVAPSAGRVLLAWQATDATSTAPTVIPSGFETTPLVDATSTTDGSRLTVWIKKNTTGAETTVTMSDNSGNLMIAGVAEFSGIDTTTPLDVAAVPFNTSTSVTTGSASITPVTNGCDLAIVHLPDGSSGDRTVSYSTTSGTTSAWTVRVDQTDGGFFNVALGTASQTTAGALTAQASQSISGGLVMVLVALRLAGPSISAQPTDQTVNDGATATFSVTATGGATPYTYQWQDNSSGSFANVSGATSSSYGPTASYAAQGRQYRCVVTGANSLSVTSNAATLRVAFNTSGTGPRAYPVLGGVSGAGSVESLLLGTASAGSSFEHVASGGLSFAGAATTLQSRNFTFSPSGGMTFAGSATVAEANDYAASASGGLTFGGTASAQLDVGFTFAGSGGFTLAGVASALESNDYVHAAAGGLSFAGAATASESNDYAATSSGGILFGGVATVSLDVGFVVTGSGGISFAGAATAAESNDYAASGSGGILFGGEATVEGPAAPGGASDAVRAFWTRRRSR